MSPRREPEDKTITIEDARILFRNFAGKERTFNAAGDRNFIVVLEDLKMVDQLLADGWNVKYLKPREGEEGATPTPYLKVTVKYGSRGRPPRIVIVTSKGRTPLDEDTAEMVDWADIRQVDLIIRPYEWDVNGKQGIAAYLKTMFVTINEDALELKYGITDDQRPVPTIHDEED